jgi:DNA repair protein SbcD/Mre11
VTDPCGMLTAIGSDLGKSPMKDFSFVHAGDLHLDSPFRGLTAQSSDFARRLRRATFDAYQALIDLCIEKRVSFLLIAGDVYDAADRSVRAQLAFRDGLDRLSRSGIRSFLVHGNHDPLEGWASSIQWPDGVTVFGADGVSTEIVTIDGEPTVAVSGMSYPRQKETRNLAKKFRAQHPDLFQIALLHGNCGCNPDHAEYAPARLDDLISSGFNYWALGHIHERVVLSSNPLVVYPGNTQGRSIREAGPRGCVLVSVDRDRRAAVDFMPLDAVRWYCREVSINGLASIDELDKKIGESVDEIRALAVNKPAVCRLNITGRGLLSKELRKDECINDLLERGRESGLQEPPVWLQEITSNCLPEVDLDKRSEIDDFLGQLLRLVRETESQIPGAGDGQEVPEALTEPLKELFSYPRSSRYLDELDPDTIRQLLRHAELLCVDLLEAGE